jgi:putative DNA primase/helicase
MKCEDVLSGNKVLSKSNISKMMKEIESKMIDDLAVLVAKKCLETIFNKTNLINLPSGLLYMFHKTHWKIISEDFLSKIVQSTITVLKKKMDIEMPELTLITQSTRLVKIAVASMTDKIHTSDLPNPVINCKNGELWINRDGTHQLRPHNPKSYLISCLDVEYNPNAECPLFLETIDGIFSNYEDKEDIIRHTLEVFGYVVQPYKNIAAWFLFKGPGGDGKSTLLKILNGIMKDTMLMSTAKILGCWESTANNHAVTSLIGKLCVVIEDLPHRFILKDTGVKMLSENTKMEANPKMKDTFDFIYAGTLIMASNSFPSTRDITHGMLRRANVIPFNKQFTKLKKVSSPCINSN